MKPINGVRDDSDTVSETSLTGGRVRHASRLLVSLPQPYDFAVSTARFEVYGLDRATLWHEGGIHRVSPGARSGSKRRPAAWT